MASPAYQVVAPLTETTSKDRACEGKCGGIIPHGAPYYPVASYNPSCPPRNVCSSCFNAILKRGGTAMRESQAQPNPQEVQAAVRASRSKASINPPAVMPVPPGYGTRHQGHVPSGTSRMPPPPVPMKRKGPQVHVPSAWSSHNSPGASAAPASVPSHSGYSRQHESYTTEVERWSAGSKGLIMADPPVYVETISLSVAALHEGTQGRILKGRSPGIPFGNIVEGKKGVNARIAASGLVDVARTLIKQRIEDFCRDFPWRMDEFVVRDTNWVDLSKHDEDPRTAQGYFYQECLKLKQNRWSFTTKHFQLYVVVPQDQWDEYLQFAAQQNSTAVVTAIPSEPSTDTRAVIAPIATPSTESSGTMTTTIALPSIVTKRPRKAARTPRGATTMPEDLFLNSESKPAIPTESIPVTLLASKRPYHAMHSRTGSTASVTGNLPPLKKPIKAEPSSPDHSILQEALRVGGGADFNESDLLGGQPVNFYPIPTVSIAEILSTPGAHKFSVQVTSLHSAKLRLSDNSTAFIGAGAFKTAQLATLLPVIPTESGIGSQEEEIIVKRPYQYQPGWQTLNADSKFKRYPPIPERDLLFREANVLYWAKALFKLADDFIAEGLKNVDEPPPFKIPSIRFVEGGLALHYQSGPSKDWVPVVARTYLCEEQIHGARTSFMKFVHNGDYTPLPDPDEPGYDIAQFLVFTQHIQFVKTGGLAYVSDYQGTASLLTDPQILTHPSVGTNLFCQGNLERALEAFADNHVCNYFCKWPGFKLTPLKNDLKGKGREFDPVIVSSASE